MHLERSKISTALQMLQKLPTLNRKKLDQFLYLNLWRGLKKALNGVVNSRNLR